MSILLFLQIITNFAVSERTLRIGQMGYAQNTLCKMPIITQDISGVNDIIHRIAVRI